MARKVDLLVTDLDGTLYDWIGFYIPSFLAMVRVLGEMSGVPEERLKEAFRRVNQSYGTSEYVFAIQELDVLPEVRSGWSAEAILRKYDPAIHTFRSERRKTLRLYDGVRDTLIRLKSAGVILVAHSESMTRYVSGRLRQLDIDEAFDAICAPEDHGLSANAPAELVRQSPDSQVLARVRELAYSPKLRKPDPATLAPVLDAFRVPRERIAYVGDSLSRDMLLAARSGVTGVWARYGRPPEELLATLREITYWTPDEVATEDRLVQEAAHLPPPTMIDSFPEILRLCSV